MRDFLRGKPFQTWRTYSTKRGMSAWYDIVDWAGGYPFEVAKPGDYQLLIRGAGEDALERLPGHGDDPTAEEIS